MLVHEVAEAIDEFSMVLDSDLGPEVQVGWDAAHADALVAESEFRADVEQPGAITGRTAAGAPVGKYFEIFQGIPDQIRLIP